jgi:PAS domain-containing protein
MKMKLPKENKFSLIYTGIFILLSAAIIISGYIYYKHQKKNITAAQYSELSAIADLKVSQITYWLGDRLKDANVISDNFLIAEHVKKLAENPLSQLLQKEVFSIINSIKERYDYANIIVLNAKGGLLISTDRERRQIAPDALKAAMQAIRDKKVIWTDIHRGIVTVKPHIDIFAPLLSQRNGRSYVTGIFVIQVDPYKYFFPFIQSWPTPSLTGETLLVRRDGDDVLFLNELRHKKDTSFNFRLPINRPDSPAALAVQGIIKTVEGYDYRDVKVLASLRPVPDTPWFLVAKIDKAEIIKGLNERAIFIITVIVLLIATSGLSILYLWRKETTDFYKREYEAKEALSALTLRYEAILSAVPDIIMEVDNNKVYTWANKTGYEFFGDDVIGKEAAFYFEGEQKTYSIVEPLFKGSKDVIYVESWQRRKDGEKRLLAWW